MTGVGEDIFLKIPVNHSGAQAPLFFSCILIYMNDDILKKENPELYRIAREGGTEPAFTGEYVNTKEDGMYHCAVCSAPLFSSDTKFDSGSGWPSFTQPMKFLKGYVYVLKMSNGQMYTGSTTNLIRRITEHEQGKVTTTKKYLPVSLVHYETYNSEKEARHREKMLKHHGSAFAKLKKSIDTNTKISLAGFTDPAIANAVKLLEDDSHGMRRTEVRCATCDAHLGHVFPDGPTKNGKTCDRFCINSVSLDLRNNDT